MVISKQKLGFCIYSAYKKFEIISLVTAMHGFLLALKLMPVEPKALYAKSNDHPSKSKPFKPSDPAKIFEIITNNLVTWDCL